ncbi:MAG: cytochrome P450 [Burkholderiaceae bacterium]
MTPPDYRPADPSVIADPFPAWAALRDNDPVHYSPHLHAWVITRFDDNKRLLLDPTLSSNRLKPFFDSLTAGERERISRLIQYMSRWMVFTDPPDHTCLRQTIAQVFSVSAMAARRPAIVKRINSLLSTFAERDTIDFIADFAGPLPALVIMDILGVPESELPRMKALSDQIAGFIGSARNTPDKYAVAEQATVEMAGIFRVLIDKRKREPGDDALTAMMHAEYQGERLGDDDLIASCILMLFAGHETTTNLLGNGLLALLRFPGEMASLRANESLVGYAVEEMLRYDGPSGVQVRQATQDFELHDKTIRAGDRIFLILSAANRDHRVYAKADDFIIERERIAHLGFGWGPHLCLGFPLARLEAQEVFPRLLAQWARIERRDDEPLPYLNSIVFRGVESLPLTVWSA